MDLHSRPWKRRGRDVPPNRYELFTCAWRGHVLVGVDVHEVTSADGDLVREHDGVRWHRCIRCDSWVPLDLPSDPLPGGMPARVEIELPNRGPILRDKYVLRIIACERAVHVVIFGGLAIALLAFVGKRAELEKDYIAVMNAISGTTGNATKPHGLLEKFHHLLLYNPHDLTAVAAALGCYAALEATEMVGLWFTKRWAEYLTFLATLILVPVEIEELTKSITVFKVGTLVINLAIAAYLLWAKRLFGLHGGQKATDELHREMSGWHAIEQASPHSVTLDTTSA